MADGIPPYYYDLVSGEVGGRDRTGCNTLVEVCNTIPVGSPYCVRVAFPVCFKESFEGMITESMAAH